jgi:hypothetical protein
MKFNNSILKFCVKKDRLDRASLFGQNLRIIYIHFLMVIKKLANYKNIFDVKPAYSFELVRKIN